MYQVLGLRKTQNTEPQQFELQLRDKENLQHGYEMDTLFGTEPELRARLKEAGMVEAEIDRLFWQAS
jgi:hypothetical protein